MNDINENFHSRANPNNVLPHIFSERVTRFQSGINGIIFFFFFFSSGMLILEYNGPRPSVQRANVPKVQLVSDRMGRPLWYSGPHLGVTNDSDLAYIAFQPRLITPYKRLKCQITLTPVFLIVFIRGTVQ